MISGHKNAKFIKNELIGNILKLDTENKYVDLQLLDGIGVYKNDHNIMKFQWTSLTYIVGS